MKWQTFASWLLAAWLAATCAWGQSPKIVVVRGKALVDIESLRDASGNPVKPWDFSPAQASINTEAIQRWADRLGAQDGTFDGLYVSGKAYAINDTIEDRNGYGSLVIYGAGGKSNGIPIDVSTAGWSGEPGSARYHLVSRFVWVGHPDNGGQPYTDRPMFRLSGFGPVINGICFRGWHKNSTKRNPDRPEQMLHTAIELTKDAVWADPAHQIVGQYFFGANSSKADFNGNTFVHCQRCFRSATPKLVKTVNDDGTPRSPEQYTEHEIPQHADTLFFGFNIADACQCFYEIDNDQAVAHVGTYLKMTGRVFEPHCVVRAIRGGKVHFDSIVMVSKGTVFETKFVSSSNGDFSCDSLWWDASALSSDGAVSPWINFKGDSQFPLTATADADSNVLKIPILPISSDVGKFLVITGGTNFKPGTYEVIAFDDSSPANYSWTLDDTISTTAGAANNLQGYLGVASYNRYVDMLEPRTANFVISGHVPLEGADLPNMVRIKQSGGSLNGCRLNIRQAHPAMARAYPMSVPFRSPNPFVVPASCRLFVDVEERFDADDVTYTPQATHAPIDTPLDGIGDGSAANNDLVKFADGSRPDIVGWLLHNKPAIRFGGGDALKKDTPANLTALDNLSVGGVIRIDSAVSGTDTICGVWDSTTQRCWRLAINDSEQLVLDLSTDGSTPQTFTMTNKSIELNRNTFVYAVWDGTTGTIDLYVDDMTQQRTGAPTATLHNSNAAFTLGCSTTGGAIADSLVGVVGIVMADSEKLAPAEIEYRAEEFTSRRGTWLNLDIAP